MEKLREFKLTVSLYIYVICDEFFSEIISIHFQDIMVNFDGNGSRFL
jgi:hypothetical protein